MSFGRQLIGRSMRDIGCRRLYSDKPLAPLSSNKKQIFDVQYKAEGKSIDTDEGSKTLPKLFFKITTDFAVGLIKTLDVSNGGFRNTVKYVDDMLEHHYQRYIPQRHRVLGPNLATAHFVVYRGGAVRFVGQTKWHRRDDNNEYFLPNKYVPNVIVEAVDLEGVRILYEGMVNLENLDELRWLSLRGCSEVDDWFCDRLTIYKNSLEYLDISGCSNVTDKGVASLHRLHCLKTLKLENLNFKNRDLVCLLLEDVLPNCNIIGGVDSRIFSPIVSSLSTAEPQERLADSTNSS